MAEAPGFVALVLAAGQGTRMKSELPKPLHPLLGRPMVSYPVRAALEAGAEQVVVVVGRTRERMETELAKHFDERVTTAVQAQPRGTGDAARAGAEGLGDYQGWLLILNGDAALLTATALERLLTHPADERAPLRMLTSVLTDATGYGRILRDAEGRVVGVREERDCSEQERCLTEWNPGVYAVRAGFVRTALARLSGDNAQGELYLTDLVAMAAREGGIVDVPCGAAELEGINDRAELAARERTLRLRRASELARDGVTVRDTETAFIDMDATVEPDVTLEAGVHLRGRCHIQRGAHIDVGCVLQDVSVAPYARLLPYTVASQSEIGEHARIGPFSHLRPDSVLESEVHLGNFVETKKTRMRRGSKANHLAYLGDGDIGEDANIGAGTILCNYDGVMKHLTKIEARAFVGSDCQLVAPVNVGSDAYVASGTTVTEDVPAGSLAVGRARQTNKDGMALRLRERFKAQKAKASKEQSAEESD